MSTEKILQKIKIQIGGISESIQVFAEDTIHPTVSDCDLLRNQMNELLEQLAVYKFHMQNAELSPSFHLHSKVSEKTADVEQTPATVPPASTQVRASDPIPVAPQLQEEPTVAAAATLMEVVLDIPAVTENPKETPPVPTSPAAAINQQTRSALAVGLNDKFRFINELFVQNTAEYTIAIEQLNGLQNWVDTELYLSSLKSLYGWKDTSEAVKYFYTLARKRFEA